jgi:pyruvate dehydrogenase E2 component (dihydrolipoamide acetyltransferase)
MPEVAANAVEAILLEWPIVEDTAFSALETIATVETEKAIVDIEAESDGVLLKTLVSAGSTAQVGAPIAILGDPGEQVDDIDALLAQLGVAAVAAGPAPDPEPEPEPREASDIPRATPAATNGIPIERVFASPLARRLVRNAGIPIEEILGTGPGGRIIRRDVEAAIANRDASAARSATAEKPGVARPTGSTDRTPHGEGHAGAEYDDQPHSRIRKAIAARLTESKLTAPHFYLRGTARVDALLQLREQLNQLGSVKISINDMIIKAAAIAHRDVPAMNVTWTPEALRTYSSVDISVAIDTGRGLVTPVLRAVERLTLSEIAVGVQDFIGRAKAGRLQQIELEGGSLSITNLGMYGTEEFAAIINPPQAAILAVGAARQEAIVSGGNLTVGTVMRVTLSVDHRPIDGVVAAQWMKAFVAVVENPLRMLI